MTLIQTNKWKWVQRLFKERAYLSAFRLACNGPRNWDTISGHPFWTFKKGIGYDYSNLRVYFDLSRKDDGWDVTPVVKPEGAPVQAGLHEDGVVEIGHWWSVQFQCYKLLIRFRYRSYDTNIFYITWGGW